MIIFCFLFRFYGVVIAGFGATVLLIKQLCCPVGLPLVLNVLGPTLFWGSIVSRTPVRELLALLVFITDQLTLIWPKTNFHVFFIMGQCQTSMQFLSMFK